jgi:phosphatidylinositol glycan class B
MENSGPTNNQKKILLIIIIGALIIRVVLALISDNFNHPDENFQIYEQAHRLVFGYGLIPWEFRFAARSWIVPGLVAIMLYPFKLFGCDDPNIYVLLIRVILGLISMSVVISAYFIGKKISSVRAGLWAAFFCGGWYEIIYFSIRPLSEVWATTFFIAAIALSIKSESNIKLIIAGILSALTMAVRLHYFPAVLLYLIALYFINTKRRPIASYISCILTIVMVGIFEKLTVGGFYQSYVNYFHLSKSFSMTASSSGTSIFTFAKELVYSSLIFAWLFFLLGILIWRKVWYLLLIVVAALVLHSVLPLKEHIVTVRFVYLIIPVYMIIGGVAIAEILNIINLKSTLVGIPIVVFFLFISTLGAFNNLPGEKNVYEYNIFYREPDLSAYSYLYKQKDLAGVFDNADFWFQSGGYYYLHRDVPLYFNNTPPPSLDYVSHIVTRENLRGLEGFALEKAFGNISIYSRTDKNFVYKTDHDFDRNMYQPGIDDNRHR